MYTVTNNNPTNMSFSNVYIINYLPLPVFLIWVVLIGLGCGAFTFLSPFFPGWLGFGEPKNFDDISLNYV
jgi:hypothetical protein